jgi:hypothetical protein
MSFSSPGVTEMFHFTPSRFHWTMNSSSDNPVLPELGCPIRKSPDQRLLAALPGLIAASCVLLRLLAPRHSPYALSSLITKLPQLPPVRLAPSQVPLKNSANTVILLPYLLCVVVKEHPEPPLPRPLTLKELCSGKVKMLHSRSVLKDQIPAGIARQRDRKPNAFYVPVKEFFELLWSDFPLFKGDVNIAETCRVSTGYVNSIPGQMFRPLR